MAAEAAFSVRLGLASSGVAYASCSSDKRRRCSPGGMAGSRHASEAKAALAGSLVGQPPLKACKKLACSWRNAKQKCFQVRVFNSADLEVFRSDDFILGRSLGTVGFLNVSSFMPPARDAGGASGYNQEDLNRISQQNMETGEVKIRLYSGRIIRGKRMNAKVVLKVYPPRGAPGGKESDMMAANEVRAHAVLQGEGDAPLLSRLLGGFQVESTGEQWLVFYDQGTVTAADYAAMAAEATARGVAVGTVEFLDKFDPSKVIARRRRFVLSILQQVFCALRFMHDRGFLHQSLGPASVVLSTTDEIDAGTMRARLRDLSFAVDIRDETMLASGTREDGDGSSNNSRDDGGTSPPDPVQEWASRDLWRRAAMASGSSGRDGSSDSLTMGGIPFQSSLSGGVGGATPLTARLARRAYGVADDVYAAGLLLLYLAFVPFAEPGSVDGPSLQRLVEGTFRLDLSQLRDYCDADPRWAQAVRFLDAGGKPREDGQPGGEGSGWHLLSLMMNANYRERPTMEAVLQHPWLWG